MAIEKKLICFARLEEFERQLAAGNILDYSIVFIQDAKKIWTRGTYYDCNSDIKQDNLVSGTNIKTINGESILGEGDLTVEGGAKVYELDLTGKGNFEGYITEEEWNIIKDSDRIKIITGIFSTEIVQFYYPSFEFFGDIAVFGSPLGVQGGVATTYVFTGANITEYPPYSYTISDVFFPTKTSQLENDSNFVSSDGLKTINGESILGEGNIVISGGIDGDYLPSTGGTIDGELDVIGSIAADTVSSNRYENEDGTAALTFSTDGLSLEISTGAEILSVTSTGDGTKFLSDDGTYKIIDTSGGSSSGGGEDIRYFTEFTVEQILEHVKATTISADNTELLTAMQNNKLVCIPYKDNAMGFVVASYKEGESYIYILDERVQYKLNIMPSAILIVPIYLSHNTVYSNNTTPWLETVYDNLTYIESNPATGILRFQIMEDLLIGSTMRFTTGEDCTLQISGQSANNLLWANGVIPTIEPGVTYELSVRTDYTDARRAYAALTPFKSVE